MTARIGDSASKKILTDGTNRLNSTSNIFAQAVFLGNNIASASVTAGIGCLYIYKDGTVTLGKRDEDETISSDNCIAIITSAGTDEFTVTATLK